MIDILKEVSRYVPTHEGNMQKCFFGGDQLTSERARNAQLAMQDGSSPIKRLEGFVCKSEDWHARVNFLQLIMKVLYNEKSDREPGTLCRLQKLLNRRYVSKKVTKHVAAVEEFLEIVTDAYVTKATLDFLGMASEENSSDALKDILDAENPTSMKNLAVLLLTNMCSQAVEHGIKALLQSTITLCLEKPFLPGSAKKTEYIITAWL